MSDLKTCPFCLEEIPVRAIKCRFCESMVDDIKISVNSIPGEAQAQVIEEIPVRAIKCSKCDSVIEDIRISVSRAPFRAEIQAKEQKRSSTAPRQEVYYQPAFKKKKGKGVLVPLAILLVLLLALGTGAGYWFLLRGDDAAKTVEVTSGDIIGSWSGGSVDNEVYFQFLPNDMVNVAVVPEGYWFRTQYRLVKDETKSYLELYHQGLAEWDRAAELAYNGSGRLLMTDTFDGVVLRLEKITDAIFREAIADLNFER